jgi:hypothetical protein
VIVIRCCLRSQPSPALVGTPHHLGGVSPLPHVPMDMFVNTHGSNPQPHGTTPGGTGGGGVGLGGMVPTPPSATQHAPTNNAQQSLAGWMPQHAPPGNAAAASVGGMYGGQGGMYGSHPQQPAPPAQTQPLYGMPYGAAAAHAQSAMGMQQPMGGYLPQGHAIPPQQQPSPHGWVPTPASRAQAALPAPQNPTSAPSGATPAPQSAGQGAAAGAAGAAAAKPIVWVGRLALSPALLPGLGRSAPISLGSFVAQSANRWEFSSFRVCSLVTWVPCVCAAILRKALC